MLRPILVYFFLVLLLRIFGKEGLAQLNPLDLVVLLSLSNTVQNAIIGDDNSVTGGFIGAFTLLGVNYLVVRYLFKHRRLDELVEGKPSILIEHGKIKKGALAKELLSLSELQTVAHRQGFSSLEGNRQPRSGTRRQLLYPVQGTTVRRGTTQGGSSAPRIVESPNRGTSFGEKLSQSR